MFRSLQEFCQLLSHLTGGAEKWTFGHVPHAIRVCRRIFERCRKCRSNDNLPRKIQKGTLHLRTHYINMLSERGERIADRCWCGCLLVDDGWPIREVGLCRLTYLLLVWFQIFCQKSFDRASNDFGRMQCIYIIGRRRRRKATRIAYAASLSVFNIAS